MSEEQDRPTQPAWELVSGDIAGNRLDPEVRRLEVPGGWLYQIEYRMQMEGEVQGVSYAEGWHAPVFVPYPPAMPR